MKREHVFLLVVCLLVFRGKLQSMSLLYYSLKGVVGSEGQGATAGRGVTLFSSGSWNPK